MKACSASCGSLDGSVAKGPWPLAVPAIAITESRHTPSATPLGWHRKAIHPRQGSGRKDSGPADACPAGSVVNTAAAVNASSANEAPTSPTRQTLRPMCSDCRQVRKIGANTSTPIRSPSHQVCQEWRNCSCDTAPATESDAAPQVEAMRQATAAMPVKRSVAGPDSNICGMPTQRCSAPAQASAWTVEPNAIENAMAMVVQPNASSAVVSATARLTSTAPIATPGQTRGPQSRMAARATPEGGHTGVA